MDGQKWEKVLSDGKKTSGETMNVSGVAIANWVTDNDWATMVTTLCISLSPPPVQLLLLLNLQKAVKLRNFSNLKILILSSTLPNLEEKTLLTTQVVFINM